jgi:hypothetical protein
MMGYLFYLLPYLVPVVAGILTIFVGNWLSRILFSVFEVVYGPITKRIYKDQEIKAEKTKLFFTRIAKGFTVGLLNWILVYLFGLSTYILFAVFLAFLIKFSEPFDAYIYYEICDSNEKQYKTLLLKFKVSQLFGYLVAVLPGTIIG